MNKRRPYTFVKTIAAAATPERLSATSVILVDLTVHVDTSSTPSYAFIGDSSVNATTGSQRGRVINKPTSAGPGGVLIPGPVDLYDIFAAVTTDGDKIHGCGWQID